LEALARSKSEAKQSEQNVNLEYIPT